MVFLFATSPTILQMFNAIRLSDEMSYNCLIFILLYSTTYLWIFEYIIFGFCVCVWFAFFSFLFVYNKFNLIISIEIALCHASKSLFIWHEFFNTKNHMPISSYFFFSFHFILGKTIPLHLSWLFHASYWKRNQFCWMNCFSYTLKFVTIWFKFLFFSSSSLSFFVALCNWTI